jgi:hypothetical protein
MRRSIEIEPQGPSYEVAFTDVAQAESDDTYSHLAQHTNPDFAVRWYAGLFAAAQKPSDCSDSF